MLGIELGRSARTQETVSWFFFFFFSRRRGVPDRVGPAPGLGPRPPAEDTPPPHSKWRPRWPTWMFEHIAGRSTPIMAASGPAAAAPSGVLVTCGLEQVLEALKLLLSPGGERTSLGAGLDLRLAGSRVTQARPGCYRMFPAGPPGISIPTPGSAWALCSLT